MTKVYIYFLLFSLISFQVNAQNWDSFGNTDHDVTGLYYDSIDNNLYIGGIFLSFNDIEAKGLIKWDGNSFSEVGEFPNQTYGIPPSTTDPVSSIIRYNDELYCSMRNGAWNEGEIRGIAKWDGVSWDSIAGIDGQVFDQVIFNDELYIMGRFWERNDTIRSILKWNGENFYDIGFQEWLGQSNITILSGLVFNNELYIGGNFISSDGEVRDMAKFDGENWYPVADGIQGGSDDVADILEFQGDLYICGDFRKSSGNAGSKIMKLDNNEWEEVGGSFEYNSGTAFKMLNYKEKLYVFGNFDNKVGGVDIHKIGIWDGSKWCGLNHEFNKGIATAEVYGDDFIIGGGWEFIDNIEIKSIARWTAGEQLDSCSTNLTTLTEENIDEEFFYIFPNPVATGSLINFNSNRQYSSELCISIYESSGRLHSHQKIIDNLKVLNAPNSSGIFIIKIEQDEHPPKYFKLVVK